MHWLGYADEGGGSCSQPATPTSFTVVKGPTFANLCMGGTWPNQHYVSGHYRSFIRGALHPVAPARPIAAGDTPWLESVAAPDPGATTAMEGLAAALDDDANELLADELGHLTTPGHVDDEDPYRLATSAAGQNRCEPSAREPDPGRYFPGYVGGGPPEQQVRDTFPGVLRPGHSATTVSLHWGNRAFGERHIRWRHGWESKDRELTALALADPAPTPKPGYPDSWVYTALHPDDPTCVRLVVVSWDVVTDYPAGLGIITSFSKGV